MSGDRRGLRFRIRRATRRICAQHEEIESCYAIVADAMNSGTAGKAQATMVRFHQALDAQFSHEEQVYFPALETLRPSLGGKLAVLAREHKRFREELVQIQKRLDARNLQASATRFDILATELAEHDGREERLFAGILGRSPRATAAERDGLDGLHRGMERDARG